MVEAANFSEWKMMKSYWKAGFPRLWWVELTRGNLSSVGRQGVQRQGSRSEAPLCDSVLGSHSRAVEGLVLMGHLVGAGAWAAESPQPMAPAVYSQPSSQGAAVTTKSVPVSSLHPSHITQSQGQSTYCDQQGSIGSHPTTTRLLTHSALASDVLGTLLPQGLCTVSSLRLDDFSPDINRNGSPLHFPEAFDYHLLSEASPDHLN